MCCACGAVNAAHVQAALMCRTCASYSHISYMRSMYATCVRNMRHLQTCMIQECCTCVSCMYAYYNVMHICRLHTCKLLVVLLCAACIYAYYYSATSLLHILGIYTAYMLHILGIYTAYILAAHIRHVYSIRTSHIRHLYFMCAAYTKIEMRHMYGTYKHMRCACIQLFICSMYASNT